MQIQSTYIPSPTGLKFHTAKEFFTRGMVAQPGSGKSVAMIQELLWIGLNQAPDQMGVRRSRFAIVRATYPSLRTTTIKTFEQWVPPIIAPVKQTAPMTSRFKITLPDGTSTDMEFIFIAVETAEDTQKLKSFELTAAFINEAREVDIEVLKACRERVGRYPSPKEGGCTYSCVIFDSNPPSDQHWIAKMDREKPEGTIIFHQPPPFIEVLAPSGEVLEYLDNPDCENLIYLNQKPNPPDREWTIEERKAFGYEYYRRQMHGETKHWIDVNIMGRYGSSFDGRPVYQSYWTEEVVSDHPLDPHVAHPIMLGIDTTGLNPAVVFGQLEMGVLLVKHELLALDMPFIPFVRDILRPFLAQHYPSCQVIAFTDPANPRDSNKGETPVQVLRQFGIQAQNAPTNKFKARLDSVISFLQRREGLLIDKRCEKVIDGFRGGYHYRPLKISGLGSTYNSEPEKNDYSHIHDAMQYLCNGILHGLEQRNHSQIRRPRSKRVY